MLQFVINLNIIDSLTELYFNYHCMIGEIIKFIFYKIIITKIISIVVFSTANIRLNSMFEFTVVKR